MTQRQYVDANPLVRVLVRDNQAQAVAVRTYLSLPASERPRIVVTPSTLSEVVFVLVGSVYRYSRAEVARALDAILNLPLEVQDLDVVQAAIELYQDHHDEWADCLVSAYALLRAEGRILSYDKGLRRIPGLKRFEPPAVAS